MPEQREPALSQPSPGHLAEQLDDALRRSADPERAAKEKAYLKSDLLHYGVSVPVARAAVKSFIHQNADLSHADLVAIAVELWRPSVYERRLAAVMLLAADARRAAVDDWPLIERFIRQSRTWALVDALACDVSGVMVEQSPQLADRLDVWARDDDFWVRRAALLSLLKPLRRGAGDWAHFTRLAEPMLGEREFFIRKAIGWVLRDTGRKRPELVADWLRPRARSVSRLTLREAIKPLPPESADELLAAAGPPRGGRARRPAG